MSYVRQDIASMKGYSPGLQPEGKDQIIKLNSNENPYPPSPKVKKALKNLVAADLRLYPDPVCFEVREKIANLYGFSPTQIICGNGSDEILNIIIRTFVQPGEAIGFNEPTFPLYRILGVLQGSKVISQPLIDPFDHPCVPASGLKVFFLANPNSPVGFGYPMSLVGKLVRDFKGIFVVDEAYAEFASENALQILREFENTIVVRTMSKSYSLAGARLGYAIGSEKWISEMFKVKDPFNVNQLTQTLVISALDDQDYFKRNIAKIIATRDWFTQEAGLLGYKIFPSQANFIFIQPPQKGRGSKFYELLLAQKIWTRFYDSDGLRDGVRMTIGSRGEMEVVMGVLKDLLGEWKA